MSSNSSPPASRADDTLTVVDLFCGAGGFSEAASQVCDALDLDLQMAAVNHWERAIETHKANHDDVARQFHSKVQQLDPLSVIAEVAGVDRTEAHEIDVDLLLAGPQCTHFSRARGGKPVSEQLRASPWHVLHWVEELSPERFVIENVPAIQDWGPVKDGEPSRNGEIFEEWIRCFNALGYSIEQTVLNAADFGDPTSRERFFLLGRRSGTVEPPEPTHAEEPTPGSDKRPYRTAAEIIDWSDLGGSVFTRDLHDARKQPLSGRTMERIAEGLRQHCGERVAAFADVLAEFAPETVRELREERVVPAQYAREVAAVVDEPFLVSLPPVQRRVSGRQSMVLRQQDGDGCRPAAVGSDPVPTVLTGGGHSLATSETLVMPRNGPFRGLHSNPLYRPEERPLHTVTAKNTDGYMVSPWLLRYSHGGATLSLDEPMPTIATERGGVFALSAPTLRPFLSPLYNGRPGQRPRTRSIDRPLMTVPASKSAAGVASPFLVEYHGTSDTAGLDQPIGAIESKDRYALCVPELWPWGLDIRFRMLQPDELKRAQGFPGDYTVCGTKTDVTEQIGNAVPVNLGRALISHLLTDRHPDLASFGGGFGRDGDFTAPSYDEVVQQVKPGGSEGEAAPGD